MVDISILILPSAVVNWQYFFDSHITTSKGGSGAIVDSPVFHKCFFSYWTSTASKSLDVAARQAATEADYLFCRPDLKKPKINLTLNSQERPKL